MNNCAVNDHEDLLLVHGLLGVLSALMIGSFCGLFGKSIKFSFLKGALIPGGVSLSLIPVHLRGSKDASVAAGKSVAGFAFGYSLFFLLSYGLFFCVRKFASLFTKLF
ncbi:hypothetical protein GF382_00200 [Candidatus Falkowbacteria bacterium]|nr:hypothetical protein [Candidatus Falkowbacteria bacterium]